MSAISEPVSLPAARLAAIMPLLACPACGAGLAALEGHLHCEGCAAIYPLERGIPVLLPPGVQRAGTGEAAVGDEVSRHPYSPKARAIIEECKASWVLDLGAGGKLERMPHVVQVDIFPYPCVDVVASADCLPFKDGVFGAVLSQAVFEHLQYPEAAALEVGRVLRAGGLAKIDTAFLQPEHGYPFHFFNATETGLRHWFRDMQVRWSGIEPYQHPKWALHWFLGVYLDALGEAPRAAIGQLTVEEVFSSLDRIGRGHVRPGDAEFLAALDALPGHVVRALAAGVSVEAIKPAGGQQTVRPTDGPTVGESKPPADLRYRLDAVIQERNELLEAYGKASVNRQAAADLGQQALIAVHEMWVLAQDARRLSRQFESNGRANWRTAGRHFLVECLKAILPPQTFLNWRARHRRVQGSVRTAAIDAVEVAEVKRPQLARFQVHLAPSNALDLAYQFFALSRQTFSDWSAGIELAADADLAVRHLAAEACRLDRRIQLVDPSESSGERALGADAMDVWTVQLGPGVHLAFSALEELQSLLSIRPEAIEVVSYAIDVEESHGAGLIDWGLGKGEVPRLRWREVPLARRLGVSTAHRGSSSRGAGREYLERPVCRRVLFKGT